MWLLLTVKLMLPLLAEIAGDTQFKIFLSAAFGLTRAGIGVMPLR